MAAGQVMGVAAEDEGDIDVAMEEEEGEAEQDLEAKDLGVEVDEDD